MRKILLIGKGLKPFEEALLGGGFEVRTYASAPPKTAQGADLIVMDHSLGEAGIGLFKSAREIPKLVVSSESPARGISRWLKEPLSYILYSPSGKEMASYAARLLNEQISGSSVVNQLALAKKELSFYEEINKVLTSAVEINEILVMIMKKVKELTKAEAWSILMVDEETGDLVFEKTEGKARKKIKKFRLKPGEGIAGWVAKAGTAALVPDVKKDKRFSSKVDIETHFNTKSLMCVPIKSKDQTMAVLEVINKTTGEAFTKDDLDLLMRLVNQAALALERASLYQKMEELVITDDLTKLFNTRYLNRTIETEVIRSNRYHTSLSLIFMDIDYFKHINDNYGHLVGSKVLVEMGQLLINQLRTIDIVARYGGDEFVIVLPQTSPADAVRIAERIRKAVEQNQFLKSEGYSLRMTSSFGVASYPESAKTKEDLLRVADEAMYKVKHTTRNGVFAII